MARGATTSGTLYRLSSHKQPDAEVWAERRKACANALLNRPWLTKDGDSELFYWIKDQYTELRDWFTEQAGFSLILTRTMAKLDKSPLKAYSWMGFQEFREPRDYTFFTYGLWYLESKSEIEQFVLTDLVMQVREQMIGAGIPVDWTDYYQRLSMVRALKKLKQLGVLISLDGDESDWAYQNDRNVLYECSPVARYVLRYFPEDIQSITEIDDMNETVIYPDTPEGESRRRRHRVYRRLLLEPVVLDKAWEEDDLRYVLTQRRSLLDQMQKMFGLEGSRYQEGLLFFYPELTAEGQLFPTLSAISDLVMLFAGELRRKIHSTPGLIEREEKGNLILHVSILEGLLLQLASKHKDYWSKEHREMTSAQLAIVMTQHMTEWGLGCWQDEQNYVVFPVMSRWNAEYMISDFE